MTRANGLTITWSPAGSDTTVYTSAMVFMRADSSKSVTSGVARDIDGTLAMSESQLLKLPAGAATLVLARYRLRNIFPSSRKVGLMTEMAESRPITLQ